MGLRRLGWDRLDQLEWRFRRYHPGELKTRSLQKGAELFETSLPTSKHDHHLHVRHEKLASGGGVLGSRGHDSLDEDEPAFRSHRLPAVREDHGGFLVVPV